ncbi:38220_t:CDS:2 [Gigaspora margarita]|uniref:38220_t:CDS:1 n=1 Tax=Gigaspora margarita TaxID=4874 RepID=A0ABM8VZ15_GIGMA|nr:38220_t:CDS:2 [Gigaspora margarita]
MVDEKLLNRLFEGAISTQEINYHDYNEFSEREGVVMMAHAPSQYIELYKLCCDIDPSKRPEIRTILNILDTLSNNSEGYSSLGDCIGSSFDNASGNSSNDAISDGSGNVFGDDSPYCNNQILTKSANQI